MLEIKDDGKYGDNVKYIEITSPEVKKLARTDEGMYFDNALKVSGSWDSTKKFIDGPEGGNDPFLGEKYYFIVFSVDNQMFSFYFLPVINNDRQDWVNALPDPQVAFPITFGPEAKIAPIKAVAGISFTCTKIY